MRDITEQKVAERQEHDRAIARARADELSESRRRLVSAQETLRRDIAGKLHGTVQSRLILLGHRLAELEDRKDSETIAGELADIRQKLEELQNEHVRPLSRRLFPSILRLGLCVGLEALVEEYSAELSVDLQVSRRLKAREQANRKLVPDAVKLSLYRIAQEALANIVRHAATVTNVVVKLSLSDGGILRLTVSDDGAGFDRGSTAAGIGLALMSDYAAVAGGLCSVKTMPGKGTRVRAEVPIAGPAAES
jgi:signal transduction histidine kinase